MKIKHFFLLMLLSTAGFLTVEAQSDDEAKVRAVIEGFVRAVDNLQGLQNARALNNFFTPSYQGIRTDYLPDGSTNSQSIDLEAVGTRVGGFARDIDQNVDFKLDKINFLKILGGQTAVVNYNTTFSLSNKGKVVYSGASNVTSKLVKTDTGWKIASTHTAEVRENIQQYVCNYELYTKSEEEALIKVIYPAGTNFQTEFIDVTIENLQDKRFLVKTDRGDQFKWTNGKLELPNPATNMTTSLTAGNQIAVYNELVKHYFPQNCPDAQRKK